MYPMSGNGMTQKKVLIWIEGKWIVEKDMKSRSSRYIIIFDKQNEISAFIQMKFIVDRDDGNAVLYMYFLYWTHSTYSW